jgi:secreted trypsin-like serine protease
MARKLFFLSIILVLVFASTAPAQAISYGEFDGESHPNVGSMVIKIPGRGIFQMCSGTLIRENVYLTASHCTDGLDELQAYYPGSVIGVVFEPTITIDSLIYTGVWHTNPAYYTARGNDDPGDVAVIVLDQAPPGITPASLPALGLLDELKDQQTLNDTIFTAVGYGTVRTTNHTGWQALQDNADRNRVDQEFLSLTKAWLTNSMNLATGNGGTCYGDSGGPHFIHNLDGTETNIVVSVTVTGDMNCKASDKTYRVDTVPARDFLEHYVTLP